MNKSNIMGPVGHSLYVHSSIHTFQFIMMSNVLEIDGESLMCKGEFQILGYISWCIRYIRYICN